MVKIQKKSEANYTVIDNGVIKDTRLSWKARGVFVYLWSMPNNWNFYESEIANHSIDGLSALRSAIKELEKYGYLVRKRRRDSAGKLSASLWVIADKKDDKPTLENLKQVETPLNQGLEIENADKATFSPNCDYRILDNRTLLSTNNTKYLKQNNNDDDTHAREENNPYTFYQQNIGVMNPITSDSITMWLDDFIKQGTPTRDEASQIINLAITKASDQGVRKWAYVSGILKDWSGHNLVTLADINASDQEREAKKNNKPKNGQPKRKQLWTNDSFTDDDIGF